MTPFLGAGITGYNFAFIGNGAQYHTPLDRRENIDPQSLQQHGENALGVTQALRHADLNMLKSRNAIYLDVLGRWLPRLPASWSLFLSLFVFVLIAWAARGEGERFWRALLMPPLLLAGAVGMGFVLHGIAALISGAPDPSFAHPLTLRLSLAFGVFAVALLAARAAKAAASWLWLAGLAIVCAIWAPGIVPYFLYPCLVAAPLLLVSRGRDSMLLIAAVAGFLVWLPFNQGSEAIMGLRLHPLFMVTAAFALTTLLPLLARARGLGVSAFVSLGLALVLAVAAGLQPAFSNAAPEQLNLRYVEGDGKAWWVADPVPRLPKALRAAAEFSARPQRVLGVTSGYAAPAGAARYPAPTATVARSGDTVTLDLAVEGDGISLVVPAKAKLRAATVGGITTLGLQGPLVITCATPDCAKTRIALQLGSSEPFEVTLIALRHGLPPEGAKLLKARPTWAVPSYGGDRTASVAKFGVPAR
jgi:hypothetical protein